MRPRTRMTGVLTVAAAATAFGLTLPHLMAGDDASSTQHIAQSATNAGGAAPENDHFASTTRPLDELLLEADRFTTDELALLGELFDVHEYTVTGSRWTMTSPTNGVIFLGNAYVADDENMKRPFGEFVSQGEKIFHGVVLNLGSETAQFEHARSDHRLEVKPGSMMVISNESDGDGELQPHNECEVTCSGSYCACCNYGENGYPTCRCKLCSQLGPGSCHAGGTGATSCSLVQDPSGVDD